MEILRIQARAVTTKAALGDGESERIAYVPIDIVDVGGANFVGTVDLADGQIVEVPVLLPLDVQEGLHAAILRALTSSAEVGLNVTQVR